MSGGKLVWSAEEIAATGFEFGHPLQDDCTVVVHSLSRLTGLDRTGVNLIRVAPDRQAFPLHRHHAEQEWTYVLSGTAEVRLGDETHTVMPGGFVAFPAGGPAHSVRNPSDTEDLVCLTGGESLPSDTVDFPDHGKRILRTVGGAQIADAADFEPFDFFSRTPLPVGTE